MHKRYQSKDGDKQHARVGAQLETRGFPVKGEKRTRWSFFVVLSSTIQNTSHIINFTEITEEGHQIRQLCVVRVVEPR